MAGGFVTAIYLIGAQRSPMILPSEIIRLVIREATSAPAAFDTSFEATVSEDFEAVTDAIRESMKTKLSLCLVSRSFHEITVEFLYEIITVQQLEGYNPLIALLRCKYSPCSPPRGGGVDGCKFQ